MEPLTVRDLKALLQRFSDDTPVLITSDAGYQTVHGVDSDPDENGKSVAIIYSYDQ